MDDRTSSLWGKELPEIPYPEEKGNYTYILRCADGTLYTGWTNDLAHRLRSHNQGQGSKYTRIRRPVVLVYYEESETRQEAMSREWHLKRLTRKQKEELIKARYVELH